jgi:hypothetical protein
VIKRRSQCTKYYIVWVLYANIMKVQSFTSGCIATIDGKDKCIASLAIQSFRDKIIIPFGQTIGDNKVPCVANPLVKKHVVKLTWYLLLPTLVSLTWQQNRERYFWGYKTLRFFELFFELHTIHEVHKWYEKQRVTNRSNWVASLLIYWVKTIPQTLITLFGYPHSKHNTHTLVNP